MRDDFLARLRCPFCGTAPTLVDGEALVRRGAAIDTAVLGCECCAFPVVDGIPVLVADDRTRDAMHALEAGRRDDALATLLDLDGDRRTAFAAALARPGGATYRDLLALLSPDDEGTYFLYRFSDPTFLLARGVVTAVTQARDDDRGWRLDVCGGSGHLTRTLAASGPTALADVHFWKLWLARRITAPECQAVCCDANQPLPFARQSFTTVVLSDAFPYIWHKRLLAEELMRLVAPGGVLAMPHIHSALGENHSAGMPLTPRAYAGLFAPVAPRLYRDTDLLTGVLERGAVDLAMATTPQAFGDEPSLTLVASDDPRIFRPHALPAPGAIAGALIVNPLYRIERRADDSLLTLTFPTPEYEEEFGSSRRYLLDTVTLPGDASGVLDAALMRTRLGAKYDDLRRRHVLLDVPPHYC